MKKYKDLSKKEKIDHILYYYKWHIIATIVAIILVISTVNSFIHRNERIPLFTISLQGITMDYEKVSELGEEISTSIKKSEEDMDRTARIDFYPIDMNNQDEYTVANLQKFAVMSATGELDVVFLDEDLFMNQVKGGAYIPLETIPELDSILENNKDILVSLKAEGDTNEKVYGIRADNIKIFESIGYNTTGKIIAISINTEKLDYSVQFINLIFEK